MSFKQKAKEEFKSMFLATLYFSVWLGVLIVLKELILIEYQIHFHGLTIALVGALILAKVVLVLEHFQMGAWVRKRPALVDVMLRTVFYSLGVLIVLLIEKAFDGRHEYGGFGPSLSAIFHHVDIYHVWVNSICISGALLGYNMLSVVRLHLGPGGLIRLFLNPMPEESRSTHLDSNK
ncbi:MAG: hypothetical protein MUE70_02955 [Desulfobacterales bacterium]|nr:hypothetical protein [Desulfobacterales bacterium]